ncbi:MAG: NAD(P)/FAD-dependent oxidoreductase [Betaproteobacteria bacterium]|nr:NAD(P)/FAD-dependent oxidoreductase [Betaproteobacteria bacterium]
MIVAILGAGPAGMSCANACLSFGLTPVVIERSDQAGGAQRANFHPNLWLLGAPDESGAELSRRLAAHFSGLSGVTLLAATQVEAVEAAAQGFRLMLSTPQGARVIDVNAIVLATGASPRTTPELEALRARSARVIVGPLSEAIRDDIHAARALILGGGDNALDHALYLAERGNRICVCTRAAFSARESLMAACRAHPEIELRGQCRPDALTADALGAEVVWGAERARYDWLLAMFGYRPNTDLVARMAAEIRPRLEDSGYVVTDAWQRTTVAGIYAAGDVIDNVQPAVATAIAQGLAAAKAIERDGKAGRVSSKRRAVPSLL